MLSLRVAAPQCCKAAGAPSEAALHQILSFCRGKLLLHQSHRAASVESHAASLVQEPCPCPPTWSVPAAPRCTWVPWVGSATRGGSGSVFPLGTTRQPRVFRVQEQRGKTFPFPSRQSCGFPSINSCCGDRGAAAGCWTCCQGGRGRGCADRCSSKANPPQLSRLSCCPAAKVVPRNGAEIRYPAPLLSTSSQRCRRAWSAQGHPSRAAHAKRKAAPGGSSLSGAPARAR